MGVGAVQFDLSGTGTAPGMTIRATRALTNHLGIEGSLPVAIERNFAGSTAEWMGGVSWRFGRYSSHAL